MPGLKTLSSICAGLALATFALAGTASAQHYDKHHHHHPRINEVNGRLDNQNRRINRGINHGQLNGAEAGQLHSEDESIHSQEMQDAAANGGHLTKSEQHQFNKEENGVSKQIYDDRHGQ
jgi:hypothetical protein